MHLLAISAEPDLVKLVLDFGAPLTGDNRGRTPLIVCVERLLRDLVDLPGSNSNGQVSVFRILLEVDDMDAQDHKGNTCLHLIADMTFTRLNRSYARKAKVRDHIASLLLDAGAKTNIVDAEGRTARDLARDKSPRRGRRVHTLLGRDHDAKVDSFLRSLRTALQF